jgi:hypothetical protein
MILTTIFNISLDTNKKNVKLKVVKRCEDLPTVI